jgi:hypothetical protein
MNRVLRRFDERRHRIHVRGENDLWRFCRARVHVETILFHRDFRGVEPARAQLVEEPVTDGTFVSADRLDVHQLSR